MLAVHYWVAMQHQQQHVISAWLLKAFARRDGGRSLLTVFDKTTGTYEDHEPADFMVEVDAHSTEVEREISRLEGPAAAAARTLRKRARGLGPGLYAVTSDEAEVRIGGPPVTDMGVVGGMRLLVNEQAIGAPTKTDRRALATYAGLMYQRAPKTEAAILRFGREFDRAATTELTRLLPGVRSRLPTDRATRRERMIPGARSIGAELANASWFLCRAGEGEGFVLGDSPVAATISLGHDDAWRAILAPEAYAVIMPLGPTIALIMATRHMFPITGIEAAGVAQAINRLTWRSADRYVLAPHRQALERSLPAADDAARRFSVEAWHDDGWIARTAAAAVQGAVAKVLLDYTVVRPLLDRSWHWEGCRLVFGHSSLIGAGPTPGSQPTRGRASPGWWHSRPPSRAA